MINLIKNPNRWESRILFFLYNYTFYDNFKRAMDCVSYLLCCQRAKQTRNECRQDKQPVAVWDSMRRWHIIRSKRLQTLLAAIYAIIPLNNKTLTHKAFLILNWYTISILNELKCLIMYCMEFILSEVEGLLCFGL